VSAPALTIPPGSTSFDVEPPNWEAQCPSGMVVLGTGFDGPFNEVGGFVRNYGTLVGGFFENDSLIPISNVTVQAICGQVPGGATGAAKDARAGGGSAQARYEADLRKSEALTKSH
jgi:hypothetical protein